jgi:hypothetical protein
LQDVPDKRWRLIRSNLIFQLKLTVDALRDVLLSPVAIICTLLDLVRGNSEQQGYFQRLMELGHKSDHWLSLFGEQTSIESADNNARKKDLEKNTFDNNDGDIKGYQQDSINLLFHKIESLLKEQHEKGGLTAGAKQKIDLYLNKLTSQDLFNFPVKNDEKNKGVQKNDKSINE